MHACQPELAIACGVYMQPWWWTFLTKKTVSYWSESGIGEELIVGGDGEYIQTLNPLNGVYVRLILVAMHFIECNMCCKLYMNFSQPKYCFKIC